MAYLFSNNATSILAIDHTAVATAITLPSGDGAKFASPVAPDIMMITLEDRRTGQVEICRCTARVSDTLTVVRAQEGTTAQAFVAGATVSNRVTAGFAAAIQGGAGLSVNAEFVTYNPNVAPTTATNVEVELDAVRTKNTSQDTAISNETSARIAGDSALTTSKVDKNGDTMTGLLVLSADPAAALGAATKQYADLKLAKASNLSDVANAATARTNLGVAIGSNVQAFDSDLQLIANQANTAFGLSVLTQADANALRTLAGLVIGTNVQAFDADLQSIAALASTADRMLYATAAQTWALTTLTTQARQLLDDTSFASMLSTLGISAFIQTLLDDADVSTAQTTLGISTFVKTLLDDASANAFRTTLANPVGYAHRSGSGNVSVPTGSWVKINLGTLAINTGGFTIVGNSLVVPETGNYSISASVSYASVASVTAHMAGYTINGNTAASKYVRHSGLTAAANNVIGGTWLEALTAGDTLELVAQVTGATATVSDTIGITSLYATRVS